MGMFSFKCKECGTPINSAYTHGEHCTMYLLKDGEVVEEMTGQYDGYGRIAGIDWGVPWGSVCDLMFSPDKSNGIAVVHTACQKGKRPVTRSDDDPNQGFGKIRGEYCVPKFKGTRGGVFSDMAAANNMEDDS